MNLIFLSIGIIILLFTIPVIAIFLYWVIDVRPNLDTYRRIWSEKTPPTNWEQTTQKLVSQMSLEEKVAQMSGRSGKIRSWKFIFRFAIAKNHLPYHLIYSGENERLNIPPLAFSDGPRGITVGKSTCFPAAIARGASWDVDLERKVGEVIAKELRALGGNYFGGICINLLRHPAWGRAQETYGEDPHLLGEMGAGMVRAVQKHHVMACVKHFAANSMENARFYVDVQMDERTLREVYLPHFKKCVDAGVASVMSAYNQLNGDYCGHHQTLLTQILREEWGFEGFVSSDWVWGIYETLKPIKAGMDVEMPGRNHYHPKKIRQLIEQNAITENEIDKIVSRIVRTKLQFISQPDPISYHKSLIASESHTNLAREVAEQSMVLLKNEQLLPLVEDQLSSIAVIGQQAKKPSLGDRGSSYVKPPYVISPLEGIKNHVRGRLDISYSDGKNLEEAKEIASKADVAIVVVGYTYQDEGEYIIKDAAEKGVFAKSGGDRQNLYLNAEEEQLIQAVSSQNARTIVVLIGGSAIMMNQWERQVSAILMAWYSGMEGGNALANILFGKVNPSGKLPFTIPQKAEHLPFFDPFAEKITYEYEHGYTLLDKQKIKPAYPFGFGLNYSQFVLEDLQILTPEISSKETLEVSVKLSNKSAISGSEVVQLYVGFSQSKVDRPHKVLKAFKKVRLDGHFSTIVNLQVDMSDLAYFDLSTETWIVEEMSYEVFVGNSSAREDFLSGRFDVRYSLYIPSPN